MNKVFLYLRLSREDAVIHDESNSIASQRALLWKHLRSLPELAELEVVEFKDDGYSGKNMERPGMQEMLAMVKKGQAAAVLCKDISRFSRDHLVAGKYLEQIFPFMGVRFIAVNDNYDSADFTGGIAEMDVAFKEILYDYYCVDLSVKVKTALASAVRHGKYVTSHAPYGYKKDPEDKHKVIVDDDVAEVVREIFRMRLDGNSYYAIAKHLNDSGIECPAAYKRRMTGAGHRYMSERMLWQPSRIREILKNDFYIGVYSFFKTGAVEVGSDKREVKDEGEHIRVENHHEAIVSKEDFAAVQATFRQKNGKTGKPVAKHVLAGRVICGSCQAKMSHVNGGGKNGLPKFFCRRSYIADAVAHKRNAIRDRDLERVVLERLREEAEAYADSAAVRDAGRSSLAEKLHAGEKQLRDFEALIDKVHDKQRSAYEEYRFGSMDRDAFMEKKQQLDLFEEDAKEQVEAQRKEVAEMERRLGEYDDTADVFSAAGGLSFDALTKDMADTFVDRVTVWPGGKVEVAWKFGKKYE